MIMLITCSLVFHFTSSPSIPTSTSPSLIPTIYEHMKPLPLSYSATYLSQAVLLHPLHHYRTIPLQPQPIALCHPLSELESPGRGPVVLGREYTIHRARQSSNYTNKGHFLNCLFLLITIFNCKIFR